MRGMEVEFEWPFMQQALRTDKEGRDEYLELFQNNIWIQVAEKFSGCSARRRDGAGEIKRSPVRLAIVNVWVVTVIRCMNELEARDGQKEKLFDEKQKNKPELALETLNEYIRILV